MGKSFSKESIAQMRADQQQLLKPLESTDFGYEYPRDTDGNLLDFRPTSELSESLVTHVMEKARLAMAATNGVKENWRKMDWTLNAYMPPDAKDLDVMTMDGRKPVTVVIPMTFASQELYMTYMTNAFLRTPTIHKYMGLGGMDRQIGGALLERVVGKQNLWFKESRKLGNAWRDMFRYGFGMVSPQWKKHRARTAILETVDSILGAMLEDGGFPGINVDDTLRFFEDDVVFEGNECQNLDPYKVILDPNTPILDIQKAEFVGWIWRDDSMQWLGVEEDPEEFQFNGKYGDILTEGGHCTSSLWEDDESGRRTKQRTSNPMDFMDPRHNHSCHNITMLMNIIPRRFGVGPEDRPIKHLITISGDMIVRQFKRLGLDHGMYPVAVTAANADAYDVVPVSHLMTTYGMQQMVDWFMKSHVDNVRKAMNDMIIYDPSMIDQDDLMNPGPGKLIRMKQSAYGLNNLDAYVKQLNVSDVTARHTVDVQLIIDLMRQANGTVDIAMGDLSNLPERPTATGINAAQQGALSRLQMYAGLISVDFMRDVAWQEAYNTLQFMDRDVMVRIQGDYDEQLRTAYGLQPGDTTIPVTPMDLDPSFDVVPHDDSLQQLENTQIMGQVLQTAMQIEGVGGEVFEKLNIVPMFMQWASRAGFTNVHEFQRLNVATVQDEVVEGQIQQGNLIPAQEVGAA